MNYDRDEWRRPWRSGEGPGLAVDETAVSPPVDDVAGQSETSTAEDVGEDVDEHVGEDVGQVQVGSVTDVGSAATSGYAGPAAVDDEPSHAPDASQHEPITRYPLPPPAGWGEQSNGPGSPAGSVRPPDTTGTVDAPASQPRRGSVAGVLAVALIGGVVGAGAVVGAQQLLATDSDQTTSESQTLAAPTIEPLTEGSVVPAVAEAVTPSVVRIDVSTSDPAAMMGMGGLGSGVIYRSDGYVLTNHHVIDAADDVIVRLASGEVLEAEVVGSDELNDLAVLEVDGDELPEINVRSVDEEPLVVGETVVAIGSPFGLDASVTTGIISALDREIRLDEQDAAGGMLTIPSVVQTDAAINPGNSGGALVDAQGRLVGVNTAILSNTGTSQGVGFAVSAEQALVSADQLIDEGFVRHPLLGVTGIDVTPDVAEQFDLSANQGAIVESVQEGTGADEADVRPGDLIVAVDGEQLATMGELVAEVRRHAPGDVLSLEMLRDGEQITVDVELGERPR